MQITTWISLLVAAGGFVKSNVGRYDEFQDYLAETRIDPSAAKTPPPTWAAEAIEKALTASFGAWAN